MADIQTIAIWAMLITLSVVGYLELRYIRRRRERRDKAADLPDMAHNEIATTKSIAEVLGRSGVRSGEAMQLIHEAEVAARNRNYRVAIDLAEKAKAVLRTTKQKYQQRGDLAKLEEIGRAKSTAPEEMTTEEKITKEFPPNRAPSHFEIGLARDDIAAAKEVGLDTKEAEEHLSIAQGSFDVGDYNGALHSAVRARHVIDNLHKSSPTVVKAAPPAGGAHPVAHQICSSCGAPLTTDDQFCRKCGVKVQHPSKCASCGAAVTAEDEFCRKCGAKVG